MATIAEIRAQHPGAYDDMSDQELGDALYKKHYSDMPRADFDAKVGLQTGVGTTQNAWERTDQQVADDRATIKKDEYEALPEWKQRVVDIFDLPEMLGRGAAASVGIKPEKAAATMRTGLGLSDLTYEDELKKQEQIYADQQARQGWYGTGAEVAGAVGTGLGAAKGGLSFIGKEGMKRLPRFAGLGAEGAAWGAAGAYGNDQDVGTGAILGGVAAPAASFIGQGLMAGAKEGGKLWSSVFRPKSAAMNRAAEATATDMKAGNAFSNQMMEEMQDRGLPVVGADFGGVNTQGLLGQATSISPDAAAMAQKTLGGRGEERAVRMRQALSDAVGVDLDDTNMLSRLDAASKTSRKPLYDAAYSDPNGQSLWDDEFANLAKSKDVQQAMRQAADEATNVAAIEGVDRVRSPFQFTPDGAMTMQDGIAPNLPFWDIVQRELRKVGQKGSSSAFELRRRLNQKLDAAVPKFGEARERARDLFGAEDAYEWGTKVAKSNIGKDEFYNGYGKLTEPEKKLFGIALAKQHISKLDNTGNVKLDTRKVAREAYETFGEKRGEELMAQIAMEKTMKNLENAVSKNPVFKDFMVNAGGGGVAGYALGSYLTGDPAAGGGGGALAGAVAGRYILPKIGNKLIEKEMKEVAELLLSPDPAVREKILEKAKGNLQFRQTLDAFGDRLALLAKGSVAASQAGLPEQ